MPRRESTAEAENEVLQAYAGRPFGCRTHFCEAAGGPAPRKVVWDVIQRLETIDHQLGGDGPANFVAAVRRALKTR